jgi:uncharacterized coiled-coil DUF342 family protein
MDPYQKIEANQKKIKKLESEIEILKRQAEIRAKFKSGGILTTEELKLLAPGDRQKALMQSISNKARKYGL